MSDGATATGYHVPLFHSEIQPMPLSTKATASSSATLPEVGVPAPRVSVVIPLYNHEKYIEAAIQSVLVQTVRPTEIIVIDDGSTDGSADVVRHLCKDHPEIIFWSWPNQGAHHTLNAGILRATGDFVAFLNSDDCFAPDRLAACLALVQSEPSIDVVATRASFLDDDGKAVANPWYEGALAFYRQEGDVAFALFRANFLVTTSNLFVRRSVFESVGTFAPLRYTHDLEFILRLVLGKKNIHFLDKPLVSYRLHEKNTISENKAREDIERSAVFAYFLHRQWRGEAASGPWRNALARYVEVLGQQDLLEMVEEFLSLIEDGSAQEVPAVAGALSNEFKGFLGRLGVDWISHGSAEPLLQRFAAAREVFLRRKEEAADEVRLRVDIQWLTEQRDAWEQMAQAQEVQSKSLTLALQELRTGNAWLDSQSQAWEHAAAEREQSIAQLQGQVQDALAGNAWLASQSQAWEHTAAEREQSIAQLQGQVQEALAGNAWLEVQRQAWERAAAEREQSVAQLQVQLQDALAGNAWLESQRIAWEHAAAEREQSIAQLQGQVQDALAGNAWLESQRQAWERAAAERDQSICTLTEQLHETADSLTEHGAILDRIRNHWGMRFVNFLLRNKLFY